MLRIDTSSKKKLKGTGSTALIPSLEQARDETREPTIDSWARRMMERDFSTEGQDDFFLGKLDEHPDGEVE
jgi:indoleamine 2,3-dioxygenase